MKRVVVGVDGSEMAGTGGLARFTGLSAGGVALKVLHHASLSLALIPARR